MKIIMQINIILMSSFLFIFGVKACPLKCSTTTVHKCHKSTTLLIPTTTTTQEILTTTTQQPTTTTTTTQPTTGPSDIPITNGGMATLTYFTDSVTQCYGANIPPGNGLAVNPLLLGFTLDDWNSRFANADPNRIPWCGRMMNVTVNGNTYVGRIVDTCNPGGEGAFIDPNTGQIIGGKCDYDNVIDLYSNAGLSFLQNTVGDDFYRGNVDWVIY